MNNRVIASALCAAVLLVLTNSPAAGQLSLRGSEWVRLRSAARLILDWRVGVAPGALPNATFLEAVDQTATAPLFLRIVEGSSAQRVSADIPKNLDYNLTAQERQAVTRRLSAAGVRMAVYSLSSPPVDEAEWRKVFEFAKSLSAEIVIPPAADSPPLLDKLAAEFGIQAALRGGTAAAPLRAADLASAKGRLLTVHLRPGARLGELVRELYRSERKPLVILVDGPDPANTLRELEDAMRPFAAERVEQLSKTEPVKGPERLSAEVRAAIDAAVPARAPAKPKKPRRLLVMDLTIAYPPTDHLDSGSAANFALRAAASKTGVFEAVFSNDIANLKYANLKKFDALYLNNTVGQVFLATDIRDSLLRYVREGGGIAGHHGTSHAAQDWLEFGELLGARGGSHKSHTEKAAIHLDDPASPLTASFKGRDFEFVDEFYRFMPEGPYSRGKVRVLMSMDAAKTDMTQLPNCAACSRPDGDYPISWIRNYGKGRVFYLSLGHNPTIFMTPAFFEHVLGGIQFALGDLDADATPVSK